MVPIIYIFVYTSQLEPFFRYSYFLTEALLTPEQKLERALAAAQALAPKLPSYMNPGAMNPLKFQTLQDKRKLLWSKKKVRHCEGVLV